MRYNKTRRISRLNRAAVVAQLVERVLGKDEVTSSILVNGSSKPQPDTLQPSIDRNTA